MINNAMELRAFERMEEDIRLIGYFKGEDSCQSTCKLNDALAVSWTSPDGGEMDWKYISVRPSYHFIVPGWQHDQRLMTTECILTCCFAGSRQWRLLTLKRAFWNQLLDISFNTVDVCLFFSFVLDFPPFIPRLQSFPRGFRAFPTIYQVLCYIWKICE